MTVRNFDSLFAPASVALVGASTKPGSVGAIVAQNLLHGGFAGPIWFVNPKHRIDRRAILAILRLPRCRARPTSPFSSPRRQRSRH